MGLRKPPYAFTENGVAMLSSVLRSPLAIQVNIGVMRAFTEFLDIEDILHDQNDINESTRMQLENITLALSELQTKEPKQKPRLRHCGVAPMRVSLTYSFQLYFLILWLWPVVITLAIQVKMTSFLQIVLPFRPILCSLNAQILIDGNKRMTFNSTIVNDSVFQARKIMQCRETELVLLLPCFDYVRIVYNTRVCQVHQVDSWNHVELT